ncbi:hypothetical protein AV530_011469 [Patagioenas fasciata monilis]|uniref:Uncharacterized protein n=1 Tax=Patagioenas fasciata monilis TaxID=372326 RepID=A0A1V4JVD2_PATFA|nr:hypothetical protein AV530_011469 [Patagioenas fasciata monilis]
MSTSPASTRSSSRSTSSTPNVGLTTPRWTRVPRPRLAAPGLPPPTNSPSSAPTTAGTISRCAKPVGAGAPGGTGGGAGAVRG